jgi:hypothetical protein
MYGIKIADNFAVFIHVKGPNRIAKIHVTESEFNIITQAIVWKDSHANRQVIKIGFV